MWNRNGYMGCMCSCTSKNSRRSSFVYFFHKTSDLQVHAKMSKQWEIGDSKNSINLSSSQLCYFVPQVSSPNGLNCATVQASILLRFWPLWSFVIINNRKVASNFEMILRTTRLLVEICNSNIRISPKVEAIQNRIRKKRDFTLHTP